MNKEEFIKELVTAIEEEIPANVYDKINVKTIEKDNNRTYTGITIMNGKISPTLNADAFYEEYMETGDIYSIINEAKEIILQEIPEIDLEEITDYEKAKEHLIMVLRDKEMNEYLLDSVPYVEKDILSYKAQFYDADAKILMNAKAYEEQKKFKSHTENVKSEENTINKAVEKDKKNLNYEEKHREERIR